MPWIDIPEGKTEVRMSDGSWVKIPQGTKQVNSDDLWNGDSGLATQPKDTNIDLTVPYVPEQYVAKPAPIPVEPNVKNNNVRNITSEAIDAMSQPFKVGAELGLNALQQVGNVVGQLGEKIVQPITETNYYEEQRKRIQQQGEELNKKIDPNNKLALKPTEMTKLYTQVATGLKANTPLTATIVDGLLGFTFEQAESGDLSQSIKQGIYQGTTAGLTVKVADDIISAIQRNGADKALQYLTDKYKLTSSDVKKLESEWLDIMKGEVSSETKVKAIIDSLGKEGAMYKASAEQISPKSSSVTIADRKARIENIRQSVYEGEIGKPLSDLELQVGYKREVPIDVNNPNAGTKLEINAGRISDRFDEVKSKVNLNHQGVEIPRPNNIDELVSSLQGEIKNVSDVSNIVKNDIIESFSRPMDVQTAMNTVEDLNSLIRSTKNEAKIQRLGEIKKSLNESIDEILTDAEKLSYSQVKNEYRLKKLLQGKSDAEVNNRVGQLLRKASNNRETFDNVLKALTEVKAGKQEFDDLAKLIGTKNVAILEKGIVKEMLSGHMDDISYKNIDALLQAKGFHSAEGIALKNYVDKISKAFRTDDYIKEISSIFRGSADQQSALTADILEKIKYSTSGAVWRWIRRNVPFVFKGQDDLKNLERISKILSDENRVKILNLEEGEGIIREEVERQLAQTINTIGARIPLSEEAKSWLSQKQLPYKPIDAVATQKGLVAPYNTLNNLSNAEKFANEVNRRANRSSTPYNPSGKFRDAPVPRRELVSTDIVNDNSIIPKLKYNPKPMDAEVVNHPSKAEKNKIYRDSINRKKEMESRNQETINFEKPTKQDISDIEKELSYAPEDKSNKMIVRDVEVSKKDFNLIQRYHANKRNGKAITPAQLKAYKDNPKVADDLYNMDWNEAKQMNQYPDIYDFMSRQELRRALSYAKTNNDKYKEAFIKYLDSKRKVNQALSNAPF